MLISGTASYLQYFLLCNLWCPVTFFFGNYRIFKTEVKDWNFLWVTYCSVLARIFTTLLEFLLFWKSGWFLTFVCLFVCFLFFSGHLTLEASQFGFHVFSELRESFSHHAVSRDKEPGWFLQDVSQCFGTAAVPRSK